MEIGSCAAEPSRGHVRNRTDKFRVRKREMLVGVGSGWTICSLHYQVGPYTVCTMGCAPIPAGALWR